MKRPLYSILPWLACSAGLLLATHAQAATVAGTAVPNQATASYTIPQTTTPAVSTTNTVTTTVAGVCQVSLKPSSTTQTLNLMPGDQGTFAFTVSNDGNSQSSIGLSAALSGNVGSYKIYSDTNGNGKLDSGEPEVSQAALAPGATQKVLVVIDTAASAASGQYAVTLTGACGDGKTSVATSALNLSDLPKLTVAKSFDKTLIKPGDTTTVTINTRNNGGDSREVYITDPLDSLAAQGLVFDGNAQTTAGTIEYTTNGTTWQTSLPATPSLVTGVRVRLPNMASGTSVALTFNMKALEAADQHSFVNTANAVSGNNTVQGSANLDVHYTPGVFIGPKDNAQAPEGTPTDAQTTPFAVVGQEVCFDHTILNSGNVTDTFTFNVTYPNGTAVAIFKDASGKTITQAVAPTVTLAPGESKVITICYTPSSTGPLDALVTVTGTHGTTNATHDLITTIETGLPELKKTSDASATEPLSKGTVVTYTLSARNPYNRPLNNVLIQDALPTHTDFISADNGGSNNAGTVSWNIGTLAAGETRLLKVAVKVADAAVDGEQLTNTFNLTSAEFKTPVVSNPVNSVVWEYKIHIDKSVNQRDVAPGDVVTYTIVPHNDSVAATLKNAVITDTPAAGLQYVPGTATLGGQPLADPTITDGAMNWSVGDMAPSSAVTITYKMRVLPTISGDLVNTVQVAGYVGNAVEAIRKVASNRATALVRPKMLNFAPLNDIVGLVYIDRNRNAIFDKGLDTPVERARVILAGGRLALTDKEGRYHFANVALGTQALRLDPITTTYNPLNTPQTQGLSGTQTVFVRGLTSVDFPLAPLGGDISAIRRTSLDMGSLHLDKAVYHTTEFGYSVTIKMNAAQALQQFEMTDPLPEGATLQEGSNIWKGTLPTGETILNYSFNFMGGDEAAVTDPNAVWRY